jgi:hypothetical protein
MKVLLNTSAWLLLLLGLWMSACKPDDIPPIGEPFSQIRGINGEWKLTAVSQVDELKSGSGNTLDLSELLVGADPAVVKFNSSDFSFSVTPGTSKIYFPLGGTWAFNDNDFPTVINLTVNNEVAALQMFSPVREFVDNELRVKYIRPIGPCADLDGKAGAVSYIYTFVRQ